jgi:hypothetical protein
MANLSYGELAKKRDIEAHLAKKNPVQHGDVAKARDIQAHLAKNNPAQNMSDVAKARDYADSKKTFSNYGDVALQRDVQAHMAKKAGEGGGGAGNPNHDPKNGEFTSGK